MNWHPSGNYHGFGEDLQIRTNFTENNGSLTRGRPNLALYAGSPNGLSALLLVQEFWRISYMLLLGQYFGIAFWRLPNCSKFWKYLSTLLIYKRFGLVRRTSMGVEVPCDRILFYRKSTMVMKLKVGGSGQTEPFAIRIFYICTPFMSLLIHAGDYSSQQSYIKEGKPHDVKNCGFECGVGSSPGLLIDSSV